MTHTSATPITTNADMFNLVEGSILSKNGHIMQGNQLFNVWASNGAEYNWLNQFRVSALDSVAVAGVYTSIPTQVDVRLTVHCDGSDCSGCQGASMQALCSTYQRCSVFNCIGTPVNLNRPLCGLGLVIRAMGLTQVESLYGVWGILVQVLVVILQLKTQANVGVIDLSAQQQAFYGHICTAKDVTAEFLGTLVSSTNIVFQYEQAHPTILQYARLVDPHVQASPLLGPSALTGFFYQIFLAPIYVMTTLYQIMLCRMTAVVSTIDTVGGPTIVLANLDASGAAVGQCLTLYSAGLATESGNPVSRQQLAVSVTNMMLVAADQLVLTVLDPIMHILDGQLTYLIGVVSSFATLLRTFDMLHCVTPDVTLRTTAQCSCGDTPLQISGVRSRETTRDFAFWCTGTLSLHGKLIWNPYTFAQLRAMMDTQLDPFLRCSEDSSRSCNVPNDPGGVFAKQAVNAMQVFTRCRQNYVNKQWDIAAYAQYDAAV